MATSKLRASSHTLEIEGGRYTKPKTDISQRLCPVCYTIEDEVHFLINCKLYEPERQRLFLMINEKKQNFPSLNDVEKCTFLLSNPDNQLIVWIGKFIISPVSEGSGDVMVLRRSRPPPTARHPPPAARNGVNAITQKPRDGLFSNLVYTLVVIVS